MQTLVDSRTAHRPRIRNETNKFATRVENCRRSAARTLATLTAHAALSRSYKQGNKVDHRLFRFEVNIRDQENISYIGMHVGDFVEFQTGCEPLFSQSVPPSHLNSEFQACLSD